MEEELKALEKVEKELKKIREKYRIKAEKERAKVNDVYVTIEGEKCYTEDEINAWYQADYISSRDSNKYIEKLLKKQAQAGQNGTLTESERVCRLLDNTLLEYTTEISDLKDRERQEQKRQERWEKAQAQGCSYREWMEQEEQFEDEEMKFKGE